MFLIMMGVGVFGGVEGGLTITVGSLSGGVQVFDIWAVHGSVICQSRAKPYDQTIRGIRNVHVADMWPGFSLASAELRTFPRSASTSGRPDAGNGPPGPPEGSFLSSGDGSS